MKMITDTTIVKRNPKIVFNQVDDDLVMMDIDQGSYFGLNPVGAAIWSRIENEISVGDLINKLLDEYDIDASVCKNDTLAFLESTVEKGFIQILDE